MPLVMPPQPHLFLAMPIGPPSLLFLASVIGRVLFDQTKGRKEKKEEREEREREKIRERKYKKVKRKIVN